MKRVVKRGVPAKPFRVPPGIVSAAVDIESGQLAGPFCESVQTEYFIRGTQPQVTCTLHEFGPEIWPPATLDFTSTSQ
jgi:membrane carboxypeptidase/penicillin-binding protein